MTRAPLDLAGQRVGCLVVLRRAPSRVGYRGTQWWCRCDCGTELVVEGIALRAASDRYTCPACRAKRPGTVTRRAG